MALSLGGVGWSVTPKLGGERLRGYCVPVLDDRVDFALRQFQTAFGQVLVLNAVEVIALDVLLQLGVA